MRQIALDNETFKLLAKLKDNGLIFKTSSLSPIIPRNLMRSFYQYISLANVKKIKFHDLRHTHATLLLEAGVNPKVVSERLGHADMRITLERYSHVLPHMQQEAAKLIEKFFK